MNRVIAVFLALWLAVHVSAPGIPAPAAVLLAFAAVLVALGYAVWVASGCRIQWRAAT